MANNIFPGAKLMQGKEWGFPQGQPRPVPSSEKAFSVIHITGNSRLPSAEGEATWRINDPANQNSATFFVNRDGSVVQFLGDPLHMDPWSNGDVNQPDRTNPRINAVVVDGVNANERTLLSIENVGSEEVNAPITAAQKRTNAKIIAHYHKAAGLPIRRSTVIGHYQLNSVSRPNCPARDKSILDDIVTMARAEAAGTLPDTSTGEDMTALAECQAELDQKRARIKALEARRDGLIAQIGTLQEQLEAALADDADIDALRASVRRLRARIATIKELVAAA